MSEMRIDSAAEAATSEHPDHGEGQGLARPEAHEGDGPPSSVPGVGREELGQDEDVAPTEGVRELQETVRAISRLEESN